MQKKSKKEKREESVLLGLVELYLKSGKPIGSSTLQENGFPDLSSATIRNYFAELEEKGFLKQPHSSGGRIPTSKAFRFYALEQFPVEGADHETEEKLQQLKGEETKLLSSYLQNAAEVLSRTTGFATFFSTLRFDNDMILNIKLVTIDAHRVVALLITDFGQILTETLTTESKLSSFTIKRIENYFSWRLQGSLESAKPRNLLPEELTLANTFYSEIMVRYLVHYSNYTNEEIFKTGFSQLLTFPEFNDPLALASALSLFENSAQLRLLIDDCLKEGDLRFWIGTDLASYAVTSSNCAVIAIPYKINNHPVGVFGLLGPTRMPYKDLFATLTLFAKHVSETLTKSLFKFKLSFRQPRSPTEKTWEIDRKKAYKLLESKD